MNELLHGAAAGALRGGLAAIAYAVFLTLWTIASDLYTTHVTHTTYSSGFDVASMLVVVVFALLVAFISLVVGGVVGAVVGAGLVPVARGWRGSTAGLGAACASATLAVGLIAFPTVPLGSSTAGGVDELVSLKLIPAMLGAAAAAWHVLDLRRRFSSGPASTPG